MSIVLLLLVEILPDDKPKRARGREKPLEFSYHKWAHLGVPMLISAGDDSKLFAYSAKEFTKYAPHDICPAPQRVPMQLLSNTVYQTPLLFIQSSQQLDICSIRAKNGSVSENGSACSATTQLVTIAVCKAPRMIICSAISSSGMFFAYSDHVKPNLFELKRSKTGKSTWSFSKKQLPVGLPFAHCMIFSSDSSRLMIAGQDRRIYVSFGFISSLISCFMQSIFSLMFLGCNSIDFFLHSLLS